MTFHAGMVGTEKEFPHIIITLDFRKPTERELSNWGHYNDRLEKSIPVFVKLII